MKAHNIKALRKRLNLTQTQMGEKIGVGLSAYQKYEAGNTEKMLPSVKKLLALLEQGIL